jgi:hypothetical protein
MFLQGMQERGLRWWQPVCAWQEAIWLQGMLERGLRWWQPVCAWQEEVGLQGGLPQAKVGLAFSPRPS